MKLALEKQKEMCMVLKGLKTFGKYGEKQMMLGILKKMEKIGVRLKITCCIDYLLLLSSLLATAERYDIEV